MQIFEKFETAPPQNFFRKDFKHQKRKLHEGLTLLTLLFDQEVKRSGNRSRNFELKTHNKQILRFISVVIMSVCMNFSPPFRCPT